jgi:hypothetical protein
MVPARTWVEGSRMPFWSLRREITSETGAGAAAQLAPPLEPITLYLAGGTVFGRIDAEGRRVTDLLNINPILRVRIAGSLDEWTPFQREEVLIVAPPPAMTDPQRRLHRLHRRIAMRIGPYRAVGTAHVPPGTRVDEDLLGRRSVFLPITDALIDLIDDPTLEHAVPVALVNIAAVQDIRQLLSAV